MMSYGEGIIINKMSPNSSKSEFFDVIASLIIAKTSKHMYYVYHSLIITKVTTVLILVGS